MAEVIGVLFTASVLLAAGILFGRLGPIAQVPWAWILATPILLGVALVSVLAANAARDREEAERAAEQAEAEQASE